METLSVFMKEIRFRLARESRFPIRRSWPEDGRDNQNLEIARILIETSSKEAIVGVLILMLEGPSV